MTKAAPHCTQDEEGTWWYKPQSQKSRARCRVDHCQVCGEDFVRTPMHRGPTCSIVCGKTLAGYAKRPCKRCGKTFKPSGANHQFCSDDCKRRVATCEQCGAQFSPSKGASGRFCSRECYYEWKVPTGSRIVDRSHGYVIVKVAKDEPGQRVSTGGTRDRWMYEHRYVMQQKLGRALEASEHVHHVNGKRDDNRPENLELWKGAHPHGVRSKDYHCPGCRCFE